MTLGELVRGYREDHGLSQRQFAEACGLSNGYISMLEKNVNPKTGQPMIPSLVAMKKAAAVMGLSVNDMIDRMDDTPVEMTDGEEFLSETPIVKDNGRHEEFVALFEMLPEDKKRKIIGAMQELLTEL